MTPWHELGGFILWRLRHPGRVDHKDIQQCEMTRILPLALIAF